MKRPHRNHAANLNKSPKSGQGHSTTRKSAKNTGELIDLDAALAIARDFAKKSPATADQAKATRFVHIAPESQISRWLRENGMIERREARGWVVYFGTRRCLLSEGEQLSFMQGMTIPMRCEMQTR